MECPAGDTEETEQEEGGGVAFIALFQFHLTSSWFLGKVEWKEKWEGTDFSIKEYNRLMKDTSKILCIGSVAKDIFFPTAEGIFVDTPEDLTAQRKVMFEVGAKYQIEDRFEALGGVAANMSVGLSRLGAQVSCIGVIGDDEIGSWIRSSLAKENVNTDSLIVLQDAKSDLSSIIVFSEQSDRTIFYNRDSAERLVLSPDYHFPESDWIVVSALNGAWKENFREILRHVRDRGVKFALNPGQRNIKDDPDLVIEAASFSDVLILNKDEAIELVLHAKPGIASEGINNEQMLLHSLFEMGAKKIALTDGMRGAWGFDGAELLHVEPVFPEHGIETTGAGDAFGSAFLSATAVGCSLGDALRWGAANGESVAQHFGAIEGLLRKDSIQSKLSRVSLGFA